MFPDVRNGLEGQNFNCLKQKQEYHSYSNPYSDKKPSPIFPYPYSYPPYDIRPPPLMELQTASN
jgi:hypothetical protein